MSADKSVVEHSSVSTEQTVDVIICGGGIAGLSLARQLTLDNSRINILILEQKQRPLPDAAFKVGESTIEVGAYYYADTLRLRDYLETTHLEKLGLRYFFPGETPHTPLQHRPEFGVSKFLPAKSYQIDRGKFESHLRCTLLESGVALLEGASVTNLKLDQNGCHSVDYLLDGVKRTARARWVVDGLGRSKFLQRRLRLEKKTRGCFNAAWFRARGKVSVEDFVDKDSSGSWRARVRDDRWQSTNHFMGRGYWVWLIPVAPDNTSVGIVADNSLHDFRCYNSYPAAIEWLKKHEPLIAAALESREIMDFLKYKDYSYSSSMVFSKDRWACVGEAAVFADPYYSVGSNLIAFGNGLAEKLITLDLAGQLSTQEVDFANRFILTLNDSLADSIHRAYPYHDKPTVMACKTIWDYYIGWCTTDPQFYHRWYLDPKLSSIVSTIIAPVIVAQAKMLKLFEAWGDQDSHLTFSFIDYIADLPTLRRLHTQTLPPTNPDFNVYLQHLRDAVSKIEELAHVLFLIAVEDVLPGHRSRFDDNPWLNIGSMSLDPESWERDQLFSAQTTKRDFQALYEEIRRLFMAKIQQSQDAVGVRAFDHALA